MTHTTTPPTVSGWYWMHCDGAGDEIVYFDRANMALHFSMVGDPINLGTLGPDCKWSGPIPNPFEENKGD